MATIRLTARCVCEIIKTGLGSTHCARDITGDIKLDVDEAGDDLIPNKCKLSGRGDVGLDIRLMAPYCARRDNGRVIGTRSAAVT